MSKNLNLSNELPDIESVFRSQHWKWIATSNHFIEVVRGEVFVSEASFLGRPLLDWRTNYV